MCSSFFVFASYVFFIFFFPLKSQTQSFLNQATSDIVKDPYGNGSDDHEENEEDGGGSMAIMTAAAAAGEADSEFIRGGGERLETPQKWTGRRREKDQQQQHFIEVSTFGNSVNT